MPTPVIYPGDLFFDGIVDAIYPVVAQVGGGLFLDVGAAAAKVSRQLASIPHSRVIAFEPNVNNVPYFKRNAERFRNIKLIESAVADFNGKGRLWVSSSLKGDEKGWEGYAGYSSSGMLISESDPHWNDADKASDVNVVSIDATIKERVRLMKIDVQGGEMGVLRGAENTIRRYGIDIIYVEFEGEPEIIDWLAARDYVLMDSGVYIYSPKPGGPKPEELSDQFITTSVSSGRPIYKGPISRRPLVADEYATFCQNLGRLALYTDLIAVHKSCLPSFIEGVGRWMETRNSLE